ncbi:AAA family ATPase [Actinoplanes sp. HUAS TT8]|uniref:helix-turn-helix transcriptional regulator n=1 Tax=Actinoplanes sp. HUAS TT8 TaxID=3447453 RepID=UPI003F521580
MLRTRKSFPVITHWVIPFDNNRCTLVNVQSVMIILGTERQMVAGAETNGNSANRLEGAHEHIFWTVRQSTMYSAGRLCLRRSGELRMTGASSDDCPVLLERTAELQRIDHVLRELDAGRGGLVVVEGGAGLGKSTILQRMRQRATAGGNCVLSARGDEFQSGVPFGVLAQLMESAGEGSRAAREPGGTLSAAELRRLRRGLLEVAGRRRLVVVVDDVRWADVPSLRLLSYLASRAARTPMVLTVAADRADRGPAAEWLSAAGLARDTTSVRLAPLSEKATEHLVAQHLSDSTPAGFAKDCFDDTGGNPLLLHELLTELARRGPAVSEAALDMLSRRPPARVVHEVSRRLRSLPELSLGIARAVAVLGAVADPGIVARTADCAEADVVEAVTALVGAEVMSDGPTLHFAQPMLRAAVDVATPAFVRRHLQARAARALAETDAGRRLGPTLVADAPGEGEPAGPDAAGAPALRLVLDCRFNDAITVLQRDSAGAQDPHDGLRLEALSAGVAQLVPSVHEPDGSARDGASRVAARAAWSQLGQGSPAAHITRLQEDLLRDPAPSGAETVVRVAALLAIVMLGPDGRLLESRHAILRLRDAAIRIGTELAGLDLCMRAAVDHQLGDVDGAADLALQVLSGREGWNPPGLTRAFAAAIRAEALVDQGAVEAADAVLAQPELFAVEGPDTIAQLPLLRARGRLRIEQGDAESGWDDLVRARRLAVDLGLASGVRLSWPAAPVALHRAGRTEEALSLARQELAEARSAGAARPIAAALRTLGTLTPGAGGLPLVKEAAGMMENFPDPLERARSLLAYGVVLRRAGKRGEARRQLRLAADLAGAYGARAVRDRADEELHAIEAGGAGRKSRPLLTTQQHRVAELAAAGLQNEEIAQTLFVTVKTVEWHLTQAYRKLGIDSRAALPLALAAATPGYSA